MPKIAIFYPFFQIMKKNKSFNYFIGKMLKIKIFNFMNGD